MPLRFFTIPARYAQDAAGEMNQYLGSHRVLNVERQFVDDGANSYWAFCVDHLETGSDAGENTRKPSTRKPAVDYREVLSDADFRVFSRLRELRKRIANENGVPVYVVFSNEQLAQIVQQRVTSKAALEAVVGAGDAKIEKYGEAFIEAVIQQTAEDNATSTDGRGAPAHESIQ